MTDYAIGDIHGHIDKLDSVHSRIAADRKETGDMDAPVIHLGDLVGRQGAARHLDHRADHVLHLDALLLEDLLGRFSGAVEGQEFQIWERHAEYSMKAAD